MNTIEQAQEVSRRLRSYPAGKNEVELADTIDGLLAENSALLAANIDCINHFDQLMEDYKLQGEELAALKQQEPVGEVRLNMGVGGSPFVFWKTQPTVGSKLYFAAGAQTVSTGHPDDAGFELWWAECMPEAVQSVAFNAWHAAQPTGAQKQNSPDFNETAMALRSLDMLEAQHGRNGPSIQLRSEILKMNAAWNAVNLAAGAQHGNAEDLYAQQSQHLNCPACGGSGHIDDSTLPERDSSVPSEQQGIFRKFIVQRVDGSDQPGGKHCGCEYFVLDVNHDPYAKPALQTYARACEGTHPELSDQLRERHSYCYDKEVIEALRIRIKVLLKSRQEWQVKPVQAQEQRKPLDDFTIRGVLAAELTCWHRLTGPESDQLMAFARRIAEHGIKEQS